MEHDRALPISLQAGGLTWRLLRAGQGPQLLLLHGTGSSLQSWQACLPELALHFEVLIPDLPGHGHSQGFVDGQASLPRMAQAVGQLLATLDWQPSLVAGHSAGAAVMLQMTLDRLIRPSGLLGVNAALQPLPGLLGLVGPAMARLAARSSRLPSWVARHAAQPRALGHLIASTGSTIDADGVAHYRALLRRPAHVRGVLEMLAGWRLEELQARLPELQLPLWLAAGLADRTVSPVQSLELARRLPNASFKSLAGLGHLAHEEAPARINALLLALRDQLAAEIAA